MQSTAISLSTTLILLALFGSTIVVAFPIEGEQETHEILNIETPNTFVYNSPLAQPDSLKNNAYFDFLSTLYAHDSGKASLFTPYQRTQRNRRSAKEVQHGRQKRAVVFRPLFVYKQQQVRKQEIQAQRKRYRLRRI